MRCGSNAVNIPDIKHRLHNASIVFIVYIYRFILHTD